MSKNGWFVESKTRYHPNSQTIGLSSPHSEPDARFAPEHSIPVDNRVGTPSATARGSGQTGQLPLPYAIWLDPHRAKSYNHEVADRGASNTEGILPDYLEAIAPFPFVQASGPPIQTNSASADAGSSLEHATAFPPSPTQSRAEDAT